MKIAARLAVAFAALSLLMLSSVVAQKDSRDVPDAVAKRTDVYCAGYITESLSFPHLRLIGAERENLVNSYVQGDIVFLNEGREQGIRSGQSYYIVRPLGTVRHPFSKQKQKLGTYMREVGMLRVIQVNEKTATAEVTVSCDTIELGDLLRPYEQQVAPEPRPGQPLALHGPGSGDVAGQIVLARNSREYLAANDVVYIDLGMTQGIKEGDYFTIYHRIIDRRENVTRSPKDKIDQWRSEGYESDHWRGGTFSNQGLNKEREKVINERPEIPRKVVGEMIVLKVEKGTATCLITRTTGEVNIGDKVERSN